MHKPIQFHDLTLLFPHKTCFTNFSNIINYGDRIGIIGDNGSGKSSLLKEIYSLLPDNLVASYIPQIIEDYHSLSGGQRFNKALTEALNINPSILLLDEPTNHLDLSNRKSLLRFLSNFTGTVIIASHDVELLSNNVDILWHINNQKINIFSGNYKNFIQELSIKKTILEHDIAQLEQKRESLHKKQMIEQEKSNKSREKGRKKYKNHPFIKYSFLERSGQGKLQGIKKNIANEKEELSNKLQELSLEEIRPKFSIKGNIGHKTIVSITDGIIGYDKPILQNINLAIGSTDRLAIIGDNGVGKSSLIKAILNHSEITRSGQWIVAKHSEIGYLDQHYENLDPDKTLLTTIQDLMPHWEHQEIRKHLNNFLFRKNEEVNSLVATLSGGEKTRLSLAQISAKTPKLLILDEITNNLDLNTREHVVKVIKKYPAALIVISHDEDFLRRIDINNFYSVGSK